MTTLQQRINNLNDEMKLQIEKDLAEDRDRISKLEKMKKDYFNIIKGDDISDSLIAVGERIITDLQSEIKEIEEDMIQYEKDFIIKGIFIRPNYRTRLFAPNIPNKCPILENLLDIKHNIKWSKRDHVRDYPMIDTLI